MRELAIDERIQRDSRLSSAVARATSMLEVELGRSASRIKADWTLSSENGRPKIVLALSDSTGEMEATFTPSELRDESRLEARLIRFWGDFLEESSHKLLEPILESVREHEGH
jgi:hypothetical protein